MRNKIWLAVSFLLGTAFALEIAPLLFSISHRQVVETKFRLPEGHVFTSRQEFIHRVLDWTGRLDSTYAEARWDDNVLFSTFPGHPVISPSFPLPLNPLLQGAEPPNGPPSPPQPTAPGAGGSGGQKTGP